MTTILIDNKHYEKILKKYKSVSKKDLNRWITLKQEQYTKMDNESLEKFGFKKGIKQEFNQQIKDFIIFINDDYFQAKKNKEDQKLQEINDLKKDANKCYNLIIEILDEYVDINEKYKPIISLWIMDTYIHEEFTTFPYLFFNAMKGSGKSRILRLIKYLSKDGEMLASLTEAILFRTTGTLCIDEFEGVSGKAKENLRELLNASYKKGIKVKRMRKVKTPDGEKQEPEEFNVYRPIAMANISGMESVLGDRCIEIILDKSKKKDIILKIENFDYDERILTFNSLIKNITTQKSYDLCSLCSVVSNSQIHKGWNLYVNKKITTQKEKNLNKDTTSNINYTNYTNYNTTITNNTLFEKIYNSKIDGRNLELSFPLFLMAKFLSEKLFDEVLKIMSDIIEEKKKEEFAENKDIALIDFVSQELETTQFKTIKKITEEFKQFSNSNEEWVNPKWVGRALKRLNLLREKKRTGRGVEAILNVEKAQEKIKIFK